MSFNQVPCFFVWTSFLQCLAMKFLIHSLLAAAVATASTLPKRQVPADPTGVTTITSPNGATIRYKQPGLDGVCETTPGVNS